MSKFFFRILLISLVICSVKSEIINNLVVRTVNIQSQLVKVDSKIIIQNVDLSYVTSFIYTLDPDVHDFYVKFKSENGTELISEKQQDGFVVLLTARLSYNESYNIAVEAVYINQIVPLYKTLTFLQDQFVSYKGNALYYSPYKTLLLETTYIVQSVDSLEVTHLPHQKNENRLIYIHKFLDPFSYEKIQIEFKNNNPFLVVTNLERFIDISHYGKICVEDRVSIKNEGGKLVGSYDYKSNEDSINNYWYTHLPAAVEDVQFFDTIGNNSKSVLLHFKNHKSFKFRPRYPLLRGWKTFYIIRYCVPTYEYLYHNLYEYFVLKMRAVDHVLNDIVIKQAVVKVLLPEAASVVKVDAPVGFERMDDEQHYTGLSTFGRPTVVFNGSNIVENHIAYFTIEYLYPFSYMFRAPLVLIVYLQTMFVCCIALSAISRTV